MLAVHLSVCVSYVSTVLYFMLSMSCSSMSVVPNNADPFPGTRKNLDINCLFLSLICAFKAIVQFLFYCMYFI